MAENPKKPDSHEEFRRQVADSQERKMRAREQGDRGVWFGLGMFGLVGWSVAIPALLAIALGVWIDARTASRYSWTLMLLAVGIGLGCFNAWYWISKERKVIEDEFHRKKKRHSEDGKNNES